MNGAKLLPGAKPLYKRAHQAGGMAHICIGPHLALGVWVLTIFDLDQTVTHQINLLRKLRQPTKIHIATVASGNDMQTELQGLCNATAKPLGTVQRHKTITRLVQGL